MAVVLADIIATAADVSVSSRGQSAYDTVDTKIDKRIGSTVLGQAPPQDSNQITELQREQVPLALSTRPVGALPADAAEGAPAEVVPPLPPVRLWERDWGAPRTALCDLRTNEHKDEDWH